MTCGNRMPGGIAEAMCAITLSGITPGPPGMAEARPSADAPASIANHLSSRLMMQQIFTLIRMDASFYSLKICHQSDVLTRDL
jgi:hypothetical protein